MTFLRETSLLQSILMSLCQFVQEVQDWGQQQLRLARFVKNGAKNGMKSWKAWGELNHGLSLFMCEIWQRSTLTWRESGLSTVQGWKNAAINFLQLFRFEACLHRRFLCNFCHAQVACVNGRRFQCDLGAICCRDLSANWCKLQNV